MDIEYKMMPFVNKTYIIVQLLLIGIKIRIHIERLNECDTIKRNIEKLNEEKVPFFSFFSFYIKKICNYVVYEEKNV